MAKEEATLLLKIKTRGQKALEATTSAFGRFGKVIGNVRNKVRSFARGFENEIKNRVVITAGDIVGALRAIGGTIVDFAAKAGQMETVSRAFSNLAREQGKDTNEMLQNMRELSKGTISDLTLMKKSNTALLLGLPVDRFGDMLKIARSSAAATGESMEFMLNSIVTGLGRGSKLMLDNLGIIFDVGKAYEEYAATLGKTSTQLTDAEKKQAFINKALEIGMSNADKAGGTNESLADTWNRLTATLENSGIKLTQQLVPILRNVINFVADLAKSLSAAADTVEFQEGMANVAKGLIIVTNIIKTLSQVIWTGLKTSLGIISDLLDGRFKDAWSRYAKGVGQQFDNIKNNVKSTGERIKKINEDVFAHKKNLMDKENAALKASNDKKLGIVREHGQVEIEESRRIESKKQSARAEERTTARDQERLDQEQKAVEEEERMLLDFQREGDLENANNLQKLQIQQKHDLQMAKNAETHADKMKHLGNAKEKEILIQDEKARQREEAKQKAKVQMQADTFQTIATMQNSSNKTLATIGKAAALTQIAIAAPQGVSKALAAFPPPFNFAAAAAVGAAFAAQAAQVAGIPLAEGGIVQASPGGTQAIIGEGGRDEAVIPLDETGGGLGTTVNITVNGGLLGDEDSARDLARAVDAELLKLRRSDESVSFDTGVI